MLNFKRYIFAIFKNFDGPMAKQVHIGRSSLVLEYKWRPSGIERRVGTILSKMIKFRGEILFRVGVKKEESTSTLLFMTFDAAKMGIDKVAVALPIERKRA